ncbi:MAG: hypothetical protein F9K34_11115 [Albidovulum sp.]|uniref:hypothetical protein n=1 Tax=Albidovulum sp. TaxID=1872424 RepID=UPI001324A1FC|nr:hypothetical protein [Defluviimonas sp.]KAB2883692.1 MAG: hypothetical protein F9K34_11115 [Defluviimonas sp.]
MKAHDWLASKGVGYGSLDDGERSAVADFTMVWTIFEAMALNSNGGSRQIRHFVDRNSLKFNDATAFEESLRHFQRRCTDGNVVNRNFDRLNLRANDFPDLVKDVLLGNEKRANEIVTALLIIVLRIRNNLFHGLKWSFEMRDQRENFEHSARIMMLAMDRALFRH